MIVWKIPTANHNAWKTIIAKIYAVKSVIWKSFQYTALLLSKTYNLSQRFIDVFWIVIVAVKHTLSSSLTNIISLYLDTKVTNIA